MGWVPSHPIHLTDQRGLGGACHLAFDPLNSPYGRLTPFVSYATIGVGLAIDQG